MEYRNENEENVENCQEILRFQERTTKIIITNLQTFSSKERKLEIPDIMGIWSSMCLIPGNSHFCYGNYYNQECTGTAFIISENKKTRKIPSGFPCNGAGTIYSNGNVYSFGGYNMMPLRIAQIFSLAENRWRLAAPLPSPPESLSCAVFKSLILLSGDNFNTLYIYDPLIDCYSDAQLSLNSFVPKMVIGTSERAYIIDGKIYESEINSPYKWEEIGDILLSWNSLLSYQVRWKNAVYFHHRYQLYEFDLIQKTLKRIKHDVRFREEV